MHSCVIIDDEQQCTRLLRIMLEKKFADRIVVKAVASEPVTALQLLKDTDPDIVFLDVEMPGMTGLELLEQLPERKFCVVFTTAYDKYAIGAIKTEAVDYLLKPIALQELEDAVEKCTRRLAEREAANKQEAAMKKLMLPTHKGSLLVDAGDVIRLEAHNNYTTVFLVNGQKIVVARTLKAFDEQLRNEGFFRLHQSHLVNLTHVRSYEHGEPSYAVLTNGEKIEIARRRKADFFLAVSLP